MFRTYNIVQLRKKGTKSVIHAQVVFRRSNESKATIATRARVTLRPCAYLFILFFLTSGRKIRLLMQLFSGREVPDLRAPRYRKVVSRGVPESAAKLTRFKYEILRIVIKTV